jgi:hypothetical protein
MQSQREGYMLRLIHSLHTYYRCGKKLLGIARLAGGAEVLERRLAELEREVIDRALKGCCPHYGSTELEPIATTPVTSGQRQVVNFRCKACGLASQETSL